MTYTDFYNNPHFDVELYADLWEEVENLKEVGDV